MRLSRGAGRKRPNQVRLRSGGVGGPALAAISTPLLVEGDSNTSWTYGNVPNWLKRTLMKAGGRFYVPVGGDFAREGAKISGTNSMVERQSEVVAKITALVSAFGRCSMIFQIGTNAGTDSAADIASLTSAVAAYKAAGAKVYCNTAPEFYANGYRTALNTAIKNGTIGVDGYVDIQSAVIVDGGGTKTHYVDQESDDVGDLVSTFLMGKITSDTVYTDPIAGFATDYMTGTSGTPGTGGSGTLPTGWTGARTQGDGSATYSVSGSGAARAMQAVITGGTAGTTFTITKTESLTFATGDVLDGGATVSITGATDADSVELAYVALGAGSSLGFFPKNAGGIGNPTNWAGPNVWRVYPVNQPAGGATITKRVAIKVAAGETATIAVSGFFHVIREGSASVAPVNTVAPVMSAVSVGGTPACTDGTWTGSPAPTFAKQFYLGETPISPTYVFQSGDLGQAVTCYVTATNSGGSAIAQSDSVTVQAAVAGPKWNTAVQNGTSNLVYSNGDSTIGRNNATGNLHGRGAAAIGASAKVHYAIKITDDDALGVNVRVGVCADGGTTPGGSTGGTNGTDVAYRTATGAAFFSGGSASGLGTFVAGDTIDIEVDRVAAVVRFAINGGAWGTDRSISGMTGNFYAYVGLEADGTIAAELLPQSGWMKAATSGFVALGSVATPITPANWDFISYGDSRVSAGISSAANQTNGYGPFSSVLGWGGWLPAISGNRLRLGRYSNFAIGATTTTQGAAVPRLDPFDTASAGRWDRPDGNYAGNKSALDAAADPAGVVILLYGTNDGNNVPLTTESNLVTIMNNIGSSKLIVLCNELPRGINMSGASALGASNPVDRFNLSRELLKYDHASGDAKARANVIAVNTFDAFLDVSSGTSYLNKRGVSYDGLHPAPYGGKLLAQTITDRLAAVYGSAWTALPAKTVLPTVNGLTDPAAPQPFINTNPILTPGTNGTVSGTWGGAPAASGVPQGLTLSGTNVGGITCVATKGVDTDPDGFPVLKLVFSGTLAATTTATVSLSQTITGSTAISAGRMALTDKLRLIARLKLDAGSQLLYHASPRLVIQDASAARGQIARASGGSTIADVALNGFLDSGDGVWRDFMTELLDLQDPNLVSQSQNVTSLTNVQCYVDFAFRNNAASTQNVSATVYVARFGAFRATT